MLAKEVPLLEILKNQEPENLCIFHPENKLVGFCKTCKNAICNKCMEENHINHNLEKRMGNFSKEEVNKMLEIIKKKEEQFNIDIKKD